MQAVQLTLMQLWLMLMSLQQQRLLMLRTPPAVPQMLLHSRSQQHRLRTVSSLTVWLERLRQLLLLLQLQSLLLRLLPSQSLLLLLPRLLQLQHPLCLSSCRSHRSLQQLLVLQCASS
jgi:hypothetical protein